MKIAFLILELHPNAGQTYDIAEIINYLLSLHPDWEISVFASKVYHPLVQGLDNPKVRIIELGKYYSYMFFRNNLANELRKYDIIYVKGSFPYIFPAVKSGRPTILVVHQMDSPKLFKGIKPKMKTFTSNLMTGYVIKKPDAVVTVSDELASFYHEKYGIETYVIKDQISDIFFIPRLRSEPKICQYTKLLTVGNWDGPNGRKRHDTLLSYFAEAVKAEPKLRLSMVGLSSENLIALGKILEDMRMDGYVTLKGYLEENKLVDEYLNNHIYVTATTYEGFYRQIVEGFATGMPAVAYDAGETIGTANSASANHVIKSGAGELYRNPESFINSLNKVINDYKEYSTRGISYAAQFTGSSLGVKTEKLLESLFKNSLGRLTTNIRKSELK